jgi:hypothetical protein
MVPTAVYTDCLLWICRRKSTATHKNRKRERRKGRWLGRKGEREEQRESFGEHDRNACYNATTFKIVLCAHLVPRRGQFFCWFRQTYKRRIRLHANTHITHTHARAHTSIHHACVYI